MIQVWLIDEKGFFKKDMLVEDILPNMVTTPILEGYVKPRWTGTEWQEGATEEEFKNWEEQNKYQFYSVKEQKIKESKELLAIWLINNPLISNVHGGVEATYTVTEEKQSLLTQNILLAQLKQSTTTTWNCQGGVCEEWTIEELSQLALEIEAYIRPRIKKQQHYEVEINACTTVEEVEAIEIEYDTI